MNIQVVWAAIQPFLTQLLQSPEFQDLIKKILDDIMVKIAAGVHPNTAVEQAIGQIGAAALLHLTGNPVADLSALVSNLKPTPPGTVVYKS